MPRVRVSEKSVIKDISPQANSSILVVELDETPLPVFCEQIGLDDPPILSTDCEQINVCTLRNDLMMPDVIGLIVQEIKKEDNDIIQQG